MSTTPITLTATALDHTTMSVTLSGELDIDTAGRIEPHLAPLASCRHRDVMLDLAGVTFCDSSGAALLLRLHRQCAAEGVRLCLCRVPRVPGFVLRTLEVHRTVPCSFV
ncbi:STAS domain-containing protein [Streptomyces sp. HNM0663]|uniref:STAS domain-containing protein n=1 Tax=Streptomyces chengmaiensis TaxID=3040919 RepID=A0ABT6HHW2_9ACTN|nr:STAS domain-containing protein [Streptomyces chengmaiensis]MDH2387931.1 STAS domain-containing protein [Streptomyces chengmaiensis]